MSLVGSSQSVGRPVCCQSLGVVLGWSLGAEGADVAGSLGFVSICHFVVDIDKVFFFSVVVSKVPPVALNAKKRYAH